jgi:hypothetical protein
LAYRRDGGENHSGGGRLCADFLRVVQGGQATEMAALLQRLADDPGWQVDESKALLATLQAILSGSRDPELAGTPALDYRDAVEVQLLLEVLGEFDIESLQFKKDVAKAVHKQEQYRLAQQVLRGPSGGHPLDDAEVHYLLGFSSESLGDRKVALSSYELDVRSNLDIKSKIWYPHQYGKRDQSW